jgi:hypothetical protein
MVEKQAIQKVVQEKLFLLAKEKESRRSRIRKNVNLRAKSRRNERIERN